MKNVSKLLSALGLALTVVPSVFVFTGSLSWTTHAILMAIGAALWFASAPLWMKR